MKVSDLIVALSKLPGDTPLTLMKEFASPIFNGTSIEQTWNLRVGSDGVLEYHTRQPLDFDGTDAHDDAPWTHVTIKQSGNIIPYNTLGKDELSLLDPQPYMHVTITPKGETLAYTTRGGDIPHGFMGHTLTINYDPPKHLEMPEQIKVGLEHGITFPNELKAGDKVTVTLEDIQQDYVYDGNGWLRRAEG